MLEFTVESYNCTPQVRMGIKMGCRPGPIIILMYIHLNIYIIHSYNFRGLPRVFELNRWVLHKGIKEIETEWAIKRLFHAKLFRLKPRGARSEERRLACRKRFGRRYCMNNQKLWKICLRRLSKRKREEKKTVPRTVRASQKEIRNPEEELKLFPIVTMMSFHLISQQEYYSNDFTLDRDEYRRNFQENESFGIFSAPV